MTMHKKALIAKISSWIVTVAPTIAVIGLQFPFWVEKGGEATTSGIAFSGSFIFCVIYAIVISWRNIKPKINSMFMFILSGVFFALIWSIAPIINELKIISLTMFVSSGGGGALHALGGYLDSKDRQDDSKLLKQFLTTETKSKSKTVTE